ncbi:Diuretic hormone receptor [Frankliniella fusca]|uniref:Diuretic hormone receptor n=1 Tax=Frankliniella fusca TaxID=407009 RepID=A0AAE1HV14_9NEOP|nr:Diuretic hormone receptor [Frankliniella fusca]
MCHANATWDQTTNYSACLKDLVSASDPGNLHTELTSTIYYVGYTVSTVVLTVAVLVFSHFSELHCLRNRIHMNLMLAYIGADIVWILNMTVNVYLGHESTEFCIIFTVLLQYTLLTHFLWMFVEGLYLFTLVVMTFQQHSAKLPVYLVIGWGTPLVAVVAWVITRLVHPPDQGEGVTCPWWQEHWADRIWIQAPCILVLVVNSIFLVFIMYVLITKLRSEGSMRPGRGGHDHSSAEQQQSAKAAKALLVLIPLLGITYILVIYGPTTGNAAQAFDLARALLLSTQGLLVALFYCFLNTDVRHTVGHRWERWREMRTVGRQRNGRATSVNWTTRDTNQAAGAGGAEEQEQEEEEEEEQEQEEEEVAGKARARGRCFVSITVSANGRGGAKAKDSVRDAAGDQRPILWAPRPYLANDADDDR